MESINKMFSVDLLQSHLNTKLIGKKIVYYASTKSTSADVWDLYQKGGAEGLVVVANNQTEGKGRGNKKWFSGKGLKVDIGPGSHEIRDDIFCVENPLNIINGILINRNF